MSTSLVQLRPPILLIVLFFVSALAGASEFNLGQNDLLNIAGRQRMLSQQAAVVALRDDLSREQKRAQLGTTLSSFSQAHTWLVTQAQSPSTRDALQQVNELFTSYQQQLQNEKHDLKEIILLSERLLDGCEKVIKRFESDYGFKAPSAVNLIGRMRMLSQRQAKWYLVWSHQIPIGHLGDSINQSIQQSDIILTTLGGALPASEMKPAWNEMEQLLREQKQAIRSGYQAHFEPAPFVERANRLLSIAHELTQRWAKS